MAKIAYLDCASGVSGDMTLGSLVDAGVSFEAIQEGVGSLGLPSCRLVAAAVKRHGFRATHVTVEHEPEHKHRHLHHITEMIDRGRLTPRAAAWAKAIFTRLGEAEAKVHGSTLQKVHFHEVGAVDSIADIVGAAIGFDLLDAQRIVASPIPTGTGTIEIAHGLVSVPAPATAELLRGVPLAPSQTPFELTTPTGAAIVASLVSSFGPLPAMTIDQIGYGAGTRDLPSQANVLRLVVGRDSGSQAEGVESDDVWVLETNLDDATGETIGHCLTRLLEAGARDAYTTAIQMKKNRPGVVLTVLAAEADVERLEALLFNETTTIGVRRYRAARHKLARREHRVETRFGAVDGKLARLPDGSWRFAPEYESCRELAERQNVPLRIVFEEAARAFSSAER